ncbi:MAG: hypothetical protein JXQ74_03900 [Alphaproteobacteria bacterium]|nr:hypothetical protein [Alphaproteobacteria bacterium]
MKLNINKQGAIVRTDVTDSDGYQIEKNICPTRVKSVLDVQKPEKVKIEGAGLDTTVAAPDGPKILENLVNER